jgi:hypothetical protein
MHLGAPDREMNGGVKAFRSLGDLPQGLVGDNLSFGLAIGPNAEEDRPADAVEKCAERLHGLLHLAGRTLELDGLPFAMSQERR